MITRAAEINWSNLAIVALFLLALAGVGIYLRNKVKNSDDYWVGGRQIGPIVTAMSYCAAYYSTVAVIGGPSMVYQYGFTYLSLNLFGAACTTGIIIFAAVALKMRVVSERSGSVSLPGFLSLRFESKAIGLIAAIIIAVMMIPYGVAVLKGIADAFEVLGGVPYRVGIVILAIVSLLYMVSSGYWGIAWTDVIQGIMIVVGVCLLAVFVVVRCGGIAELMSTVTIQYPELNEFPGRFPNMWVVFSTAWVWQLIAFGQPQLVTKFLGLKDSRTMGTVIIFSVIWITLFLTAAGLVGLGARYIYQDQLLGNPDVVAPALAFATNNLFVTSLFLCAAVAAGLSTLVSLALTSSAAVTKDIYQDNILASQGKTLDDKKAISTSRLVTAVIIAVTLYFAFNPWDLVWEMSTAAGGTMGAAFVAPVFIGLYWKKSTKTGAITSVIMGTSVTALWYYLKLGHLVHPFLPGMTASIVSFFVISLFTKPPTQDTINMFFEKDYRKTGSKAVAATTQL